MAMIAKFENKQTEANVKGPSAVKSLRMKKSRDP